MQGKIIIIFSLMQTSLINKIIFLIILLLGKKKGLDEDENIYSLNTNSCPLFLL